MAEEVFKLGIAAIVAVIMIYVLIQVIAVLV
jgi:hypothetical protein